jgi:hypothetical protein
MMVLLVLGDGVMAVALSSSVGLHGVAPHTFAHR